MRVGRWMSVWAISYGGKCVHKSLGSSVSKMCLVFLIYWCINWFIINLHQYELLDVYFHLDLWADTRILISLFSMSQLWPLRSPLTSSGISLTGLYSLILNTPLLSCAMTCLRTISHSPCPSPRISHFPRTPSAFGQYIFNN